MLALFLYLLFQHLLMAAVKGKPLVQRDNKPKPVELIWIQPGLKDMS